MGGGDLDSDEAKTRSKRTKEQVQAKNRNKHKPRTETRTPSNQTRRQAGGFHQGHRQSTRFLPNIAQPNAPWVQGHVDGVVVEMDAGGFLWGVLIGRLRAVTPDRERERERGGLCDAACASATALRVHLSTWALIFLHLQQVPLAWRGMCLRVRKRKGAWHHMIRYI